MYTVSLWINVRLLVESLPRVPQQLYQFSPRMNVERDPIGAVQSEAHPSQSNKLRRYLLHAVADVLEASGAVRGPVERILRKNIRIPLLRFVEAETGIVCDVSCCNDASVIKAELLKSILAVDERAEHIIRLVCISYVFSSLSSAQHGERS